MLNASVFYCYCEFSLIAVITDRLSEGLLLVTWEWFNPECSSDVIGHNYGLKHRSEWVVSGFSSSSKPQAPKAPHRAPRKTPTEGAERAGAAALARIEHQHRPVLKTSQDAIRNQGKLLDFSLMDLQVLVNTDSHSVVVFQ